MIKRILIDHGHGGLIDGEYVTPGKRGSFDSVNLYEGVLNRAQAHLLNYQLSLVGIPSQIIAPENEDISLRTRVARVNKIVEGNTSIYLLVMIHSNGHENSLARGWEIFTSYGETPSDDYAIYFHKHFVHTFPEIKIRPGVSRVAGRQKVDKESGFTMLTETACPAVYCEDLFMTNPEDFSILTDPKELIELVDYKFQAICEICGIDTSFERREYTTKDDFINLKS